MKNDIVIGIDIDWTIVDSHNSIKVCGTNIIGKDPINLEGINYHEMFGITEEYSKYVDSIADYTSDVNKSYYANATLYPCIYNLISNITRLRFKWVIITYRDRNNVNDYMNTNCIVNELQKVSFDKRLFKGVYYTTNKVKICKKLKTNIMIDDNKKCILEIANAGIDVICLKNNDNKDIKFVDKINMVDYPDMYWDKIIELLIRRTNVKN